MNPSHVMPGQVRRVHPGRPVPPLGPPPALLVLSPPQPTPCGLHAVSVAPLWDDPDGLTDTDLLLFYPFVPEEREPVRLLLGVVHSVLLGDLGPMEWELPRAGFPLLAAAWKHAAGVAEAPEPARFPPELGWMTGSPLRHPEDVRNRVPLEARLLLEPLLATFQAALTPPVVSLLVGVPEDIRQRDEAVLCRLAVEISKRPADWSQAAGRDRTLGFEYNRKSIDWVKNSVAERNNSQLRPMEYAAEAEAAGDPWERAIYALASGDEKIIRWALDLLPRLD